MKLFAILSIFILLTGCLTGCLTTNQLEAERAYYQMQIAAISKTNDTTSQPLWEMKSLDPSKPIIIENVDYIRVYQPAVASRTEHQPEQYRQIDFVSPWTNLLSKLISVGIPIYGAYKVIDTISKNTGDTFSLNNQGDHNNIAFERDMNVNNPTTGNDFNFQSDFTHEPIISDPIVVDPIVVNPVIVDPIIVDPIVVRD